MAATALLGIDIGTSSCKALLLDTDGAVIGTETAAYGLSSPRPGWSEQDPRAWIEGAQTAVRSLVARHSRCDILAVGLSGQMHGLTPLDAEREVIRPAILWNDQRNARECGEITARVGGTAALLAETGNQMLVGYTGGKIQWMRNHEPDLFARLRHVLNPKDYLRLHLTDEIATEVSDASGTGLFDVVRRDWSRPVLDALGLDPALLPTCHESHHVSGRVSARAARAFGLREGTPVVGGGGDAVIQTLGSGVVDPGDLQTTIGTAGILACSLDAPLAAPDGRLQLFCNVSPDRWHCMGVSLNAGGALAWFHRLANSIAGGDDGTLPVSFDRLIERAEASPAGANGLLFLPYLNGERCPHPDPMARGGFVGLSTRHDDADLVRSLLEGVVYSLRDIYALMAEAGIRATAIKTSGGGAKAAIWRQMQADIFGCDVLVTEGASEGGALGAALLAGVGNGVWADVSAAARTCRTVSRHRPETALHAVYDRTFGIYRSLYPALKPVFNELAGLPPAAAEDGR